MNRSIVLLRSPRKDDPYLEVFRGAGYNASCVSVLAFNYVAGDALRCKLRDPEQFAGLILTSPRSAKAVARVVDDTQSLPRTWKTKPSFVVGKRTGESARQLGLHTEGESSGRAQDLAELIPSDPRPYLFLSGSRRRDVLPERLRDRGVGFEELCVYETRVRQDIQSGDLVADWLAFFSPSGIEAVSHLSSVRTRRIAAIGPTTASALRDHGFQVAAVAHTPSPGGLVRAIQNAY